MNKLNIFLIGKNGRMGQKVKEAIALDERFLLIDDKTIKNAVVIDFSSKDALGKNLALALKNHWAMVICTTGHDEENLKLIDETSLHLPILYAPNTSIGANLLAMLVEKANGILKSEKIKITDIHHIHKKDAPSGTALMLKKYVPDAEVESIRRGEEIGEHRVVFKNKDEDIELIHKVHDRIVFAKGALKAAFFLKDKTSGLYSMKDVL